MRAIALVVVIFAVLSGSLFGRDIFTLDRKIYNNITVTSVEAAGIKIIHDDGVTFIEFSLLPTALKREFGYNEELYATAVAERKKQEQVAIETQQRLAHAIEKKTEQDRIAAKQAAEAAAALLATQRKLLEQKKPEPFVSRSVLNRDYEDSSIGSRDYSTPRYTGTYSGGVTHVKGYYRKDGTYVRPHTRRKR